MQAMSRPTLEVADIVRSSGQQLLGTVRIASCMAASQGARCHRALPHCGSGRSSRSVCPLRPSGHLVQLMPQPALPEVPGQRARQVAGRALELSCCPCLTSTSSSLCRMNSPLWSCRTSDCSTICCSAPAQRRCSRSPAIPSISERTSGFLACSTPGDRTSSIIPTSTASFRLAVLHPTAPDGSPPRAILPAGRVLSRVFRGKFAAGLTATLSSGQAPVPRLTPESC